MDRLRDFAVSATSLLGKAGIAEGISSGCAGKINKDMHDCFAFTF